MQVWRMRTGISIFLKPVDRRRLSTVVRDRNAPHKHVWRAEAQVFFSLDRQGRVIESRVVRSSGATSLDEEALALLRRAQPFPAPPRELAGDHVDLTVAIRFNLK